MALKINDVIDQRRQTKKDKRHICVSTLPDQGRMKVEVV